MTKKSEQQSAPRAEMAESVPEQAVVAPEKLPVSEWARKKFPPSRTGRTHHELYKHAAAAALHGWEEHAYHSGKPMTLSERDYDAALKAACELVPPAGKAKDGEPPLRHRYRPHAAALSPHHPRSDS